MNRKQTKNWWPLPWFGGSAPYSFKAD